MTHPVLVIDGSEGIEGRALMLMSALHHAAPALAGWQIALAGNVDSAVQAAAEALSWDTGLSLSQSSRDAFPSATLYAAVAFRSTQHLPLAQITSSGIPAVIAVQFPDPLLHDTAILALQRAAHDPALLAEVVCSKAFATSSRGAA